MTGWQEKKLGDLAEIRMCKRMFAEQTTATGEIPFFKIGTFGKEPNAYISRTLYNDFRSKYSFPEKGDILLSAAGTLGRTVVYDGKPSYFQDSNIVWLEIDKSQICNEYLYHCYQVMVWASPEGSTISRLYNGIIRDTGILLPPLPEQRAIAAALSDTDGYIAALERLIAKKRDIKRGAMQELLTGKRRLPGFDGEWTDTTLGDCFIKIVGGGTPARGIAAYWNGRIPWVTVKDFATFTPTETQEHISELGLKNSATHLIPKGTLITSTRMGLGRIVVYAVDVTINQDLKALFVADNIERDYAMYWFAFNVRFIEDLGTGSTVKGIRIEQLQEINIIIPPTKAEQTAIAAILSDMDAEIDALTAKLAKVRNIKLGMMQELLTGRIRLMAEADEVEAAPVAKPATKVIELPMTAKAERPIHGHSEGYEDAVILVALVNAFGTEQYPFTAFDCQKFPYLLHRHITGKAKGFEKFAAGPYNPTYKYKTARPIALDKKYIREHIGLYKGFVIDTNAQEALTYFAHWYGDEPIKWLQQFRYIPKRKDELELLTTTDKAMGELLEAGKAVSLQSVKELIKKSPAWKDKLKRPIFSNMNIVRAMKWSNKLFGEEGYNRE